MFNCHIQLNAKAEIIFFPKRGEYLLFTPFLLSTTLKCIDSAHTKSFVICKYSVAFSPLFKYVH